MQCLFIDYHHIRNKYAGSTLKLWIICKHLCVHEKIKKEMCLYEELQRRIFKEWDARYKKTLDRIDSPFKSIKSIDLALTEYLGPDIEDSSLQLLWDDWFINYVNMSCILTLIWIINYEPRFDMILVHYMYLTNKNHFWTSLCVKNSL